MPEGPLLSYHAMRLRWCGQALRAFVRRWGLYIVITAVVASAGADGLMLILAALTAALVTPLFAAAAHGLWLLPALLLQTAAGAALVWALRRLLWPTHWGDAERALPLPRNALVRSDAAVVALALLPLWGLAAAGALVLLVRDPAWLHPVRGRALAALFAAGAGTVALGVALLQGQRRAVIGRAGVHSTQPSDAPVTGGAPVARLGWPRALLWLPLRRGPARRTGHALALGSLAACAPGLAMQAGPAFVPWALAALALLLLVAVSRAHALAGQEFAALEAACIALPLHPAALPRARAAVCLLPLLPGLGAALVGLPAAGVRMPVFLAYALACAGSAVAEVLSAPADRTEKSSRWLVSLVLCVCLATEVMA
jgi:hypothetical protein